MSSHPPQQIHPWWSCSPQSRPYLWCVWSGDGSIDLDRKEDWRVLKGTSFYSLCLKSQLDVLKTFFFKEYCNQNVKKDRIGKSLYLWFRFGDLVYKNWLNFWCKIFSPKREYFWDRKRIGLRQCMTYAIRWLRSLIILIRWSCKRHTWKQHTCSMCPRMIFQHEPLWKRLCLVLYFSKQKCPCQKMLIYWKCQTSWSGQPQPHA